MKTQRWGLSKVTGGCFGVLAAWFVACSGSDIPAVDDELRTDLANSYPDDEATGSAGTASAGEAGSAGAGGGGGAEPSGGGAAGAGGNDGAGAGAGGGAPVAGASGSGNTGGNDRCDAPGTILVSRCGSAGCHNDGSPLGGFGVDDPAVLADFVGAPSNYPDCSSPIIDAADPENSLIYIKLQEDFPFECGNLQMPANGEFLTPDEEACVLDWLGGF